MKIGIPQALLYYWYGEYWKNFWQSCGCETIVSPTTEYKIIAKGLAVALDELCLPIKIFLGHVAWLGMQADIDWIMIPQLIKVESDAYICPKFIALPDLVRHTLPELTEKLLVVTVGPKKIDMQTSLKKAAEKLGLITHPQDSQLPVKGVRTAVSLDEDQLTLGILGHPYCLYDPYFNLDLFKHLSNNGINYLTPEMIPPENYGKGAQQLNKDLFWTLGKAQFDALDWMLNEKSVIGFIHVTPFACGPEAIVGDLLKRRIRMAGKPYLELNYEEHSGEAGLITRLEAFVDLVKYKNRAC